MFREAAETYPSQLGVNLTFNNAMAHKVEAGADMFLMPSRYEPCGLNQLYSLKYGTIPIVRKTGGLADSITDANTRSVRSGKATGFVFEEHTADALFDAVHRAVGLFTKKPGQWNKLMQNAMAQDYSWTRSAEEYQALFKKIAAT
jgi:starch synthase